ncbi:hypothetical protein BO71DRAFT_391674 [Aspergillus ellipticus CBS 707.79]|uniref:Uncharacterized protein n=1 Tax=Aspergillus ellipticus CBS 707.79 TaxID=1448320 RepID=A0A319DJZ0_9EURO|nr:hypothetical protein BO71DRAFT_391674 [Aspergillus ellipticus CBS 707.79]
MFLRRKVVQGIGAGIGFVSEGISARKADKAEKAELENSHAQDRPGEPEPREIYPATVADEPITRSDIEEVNDDHERQWELDEAQDQLRGAPPPPAYSEQIDNITLAETFARQYPLPPAYQKPVLPYPVLLPQRRPKDRSREFVRAYAPILNDFGIDQNIFLDFLETSNKSCQAAGWLGLINLAGLATMALPSSIAFAVSLAIQMVTDAAIEMDGRRKTNNYFDAVNRDFFMPRGLFCLVMTWNPETDDPYVTFDMNNTIVKAMDRGGVSNFGKLKHKLKTSNAQSYGNQLFPEVAPLVFPDLDRLQVDRETQEKHNSMKEKAKRKVEFAADYKDRRAQAKFLMENPDDVLFQGNKPTFSSRYADPAHPANEGSAIALLTGGHVTEEQLRGGRRSRRSGAGIGGLMGDGPRARGVRSRRYGYDDGTESAGQMGGPRSRRHGHDDGAGAARPRGGMLRGATGGGPVSMVQKVLKKKVVYLMIVNMPSEKELRQARETLA